MTSIRKGANSRKRRSRVAAALAAAGALVMSSGLLMLGGVSAPAAADGDKYFVCKYVGKPGVDEHLQPSEKNPISVAAAAVKESPVVVGSVFADEQGRSLVLAQDVRENPNEPEPECPAVPPVITVTPTVTFSDPCGTAQDSYAVVADPEKFTYEVTGTPASGTVSILFTAKPGYVIGGENPRVLHFTNVACESQPETVTPTVTFSDPCGTAQDSYAVVPSDKFTYVVTGAPASGLVSILFTANRGYVIGGENPRVLHFTNVACPSYPTTVTPTVTSSDPCGTAQDSFAVVADAEKFTYDVTGTPASGTVSILFTAKPGYVIGGENPRVLHFTSVACPAGPIVVSPAYASVKPPTCKAAGSLVLPDQPAGVLVAQQGTVPGKVHLTYTAATGYELAVGPKTDQWLTVAPQKTGAVCGDVEGTETVKPKPTKHAVQPQQAPTVLGTEAFAPTVVDAGLVTWPADAPSTSSRTLLAQGLVGGGLVLLSAAGWLGFARRERGAHQG